MRKFYSLTIAILFLFSSNLFSGFLFEDFEFVWTSTPVALPGLTQSPNINIGTGNPDIDALTIIGTGISSTYVYGPIYRLSATSTTDYSRHEYLFVASELSTAGITTGAIINQLYWNKSTTSSSLGDASFKIYMKNSALTALTGGTAWSTIITGATLVYSSTTQTLPGSTGWLLFNLSTPFTYTGGSIELAVDWDCSMIVGNPSTGSYPWYYTSGYPTARTIYSSSSVSSPTTLSSSSTSRPNIQIDYTASVDPYLTVNPTALSFGNVLSGGTSAEMTYSISGGNLAAGPIVVTAPAGFEVSLTSGSGFGSSVDVSYTPPTLTATTIYARFKPTTPNISYSGNITNVGGGASADVAVSGNSYLYVRYCTSNATSSLDEDIFNVTFGTLNNSSTCATTGGIGSVLNRYSNYTTTVSAPDVSAGAYTAFSVQIGTCGGNYSNAVKIFIDFNQDGDFADAGEQVYVSPASTTGPHTETGSILIPCDAITGNTMMRVVNVETSTPSGITACGTYSWGETEDYLVNITPYTAMSYSSSTSTQTLTAPVSPGTVNNQIIGIEVVMNNLCLPLSVTQFDLSTNGSTDPPTDISNAKLWYTGTSSTFATTTQFGSTYSGPNGAFSITGSQALTSGTNYFWLSYDIPSGATLNDYVDAECSNIVINSNNYTPTVTAPAGSRIIQTPLIGTYTVDPFFGNYPSLTNDGGIFAAINGLGLKGNVTIQINGDLTSETGTYALGQWSEFEGSGYTITIKPGSASLKTISGSVANGLIRLDGCDRVTIDGNGGFAGRSGSGSKYLLFRNTNGSNPTITLNNDARSNIIKDCYIESNNSNTSSATI
ncbi:MAG TPA: GEVED domain-containing protein, partial [Ignavibacteria bacterium]|nr:GEVED domain-containing protein [Ignavibacteria bacterium]